LTLIVAIGCEDGVVLASESCATDVVNRTKTQMEKVSQIPGQPILIGGSGDGGLIDRIRENLDSFKIRGTMKADRKELKSRIIPELREALDDYVPVPNSRPPTATTLITGVRDRQPWILEVEATGNDTSYGERQGFFHAIGSGGMYAHASFRPHLRSKRDLRAGIVHAFRIIDDAIAIADFGLDRPIQIHTIDADGKVRKLSPEDLKGIADVCETWRQLERETLAKALAPAGPAEPAPELPEP
jgi:20S proteasome alpha/beta subunit